MALSPTETNADTLVSELPEDDLKPEVIQGKMRRCMNFRSKVFRLSF
jgi:hypothetical protein